MNHYSGFRLPPMSSTSLLLQQNNNHNIISPVVDKCVDFADRCVLVNGPVIIGAGPSGLAVAAGLKQQGVPFIILDKANCIASLWQYRTYDRLKLHLPRHFCQLPYLPFPKSFPDYPTKYHFIDYLQSYAQKFDIHPRFNESVYTANYDQSCGLWRVRTITTTGSTSTTSSCSNDNKDVIVIEYICRWIVVATGENAQKIVPEFEGLREFSGDVMHASEYKSGSGYQGKKVLVVGCGNSGMEVSLDLCHHNAFPLMVVRDSVHILPREIMGISTYELARKMSRWLSIKQVDKIMVFASRVLLGNLEKYGIKRPTMGPMELKEIQGKTPVLDNGTLKKIKKREIGIVPAGIKRFRRSGVELVNGDFLEIDSVILATGYCSNVPSWLKEKNEFFSIQGMPSNTNGWKGKEGLYAVGFTGKGLSGASSDAIRVAQDIARIWKQDLNHKNHPSVSVTSTTTSSHKK